MKEAGPVFLYKDECSTTLRELFLKKERSRYLLKDYSGGSIKFARNKILPLLCEYYSSLHAYTTILKKVLDSDEHVKYEGKKIIPIEKEETDIITALQTVIVLCEENLNVSHNMSLSVH